MHFKIKNLSENALLVYFGEEISEKIHTTIQSAVELLKENTVEGIGEIIYGYTNFCVYYDSRKIKRSLQTAGGETAAEKLASYLQTLLQQLTISDSKPGRLIEIPV